MDISCLHESNSKRVGSLGVCETERSENLAPEGFVYISDVIPNAILEIRYHSTYNFVGERIDGYERPTALLTQEAAIALKEAGDDLRRHGYGIKIYDAYRPMRAVAHFIHWTKQADDTRMKAYFYPNLDKTALIQQGYISERSAHSRGSAVDLTLFNMETGKDVDMGSTFDWFGDESRPDWCGNPETNQYTGNYPGNTSAADRQINAAQFHNRMLLRSAMMAHRFRPITGEWWHFVLGNEPYPETYFDYPSRKESGNNSCKMNSKVRLSPKK